MKERKSTHLTRKNYYLTSAERLKIREYIIANPKLAQHKIGDIFGVSRGTISNISREPRHKEYYEKKINELLNLVNAQSNMIFQLRNKILRLERK
jgi:DNA-binding XRE family transcriptional regulator